MSFQLSNRSKGRLEGVNPQLVQVVNEAIKRTKVDFGVTCGMRTVEEQEKLVASGASQTMKSKHLEGRAEHFSSLRCPSLNEVINSQSNCSNAKSK